MTNAIKKNFKGIVLKSNLVVGLIIVALAINIFIYKAWEKRPIIESDTFSYYVYLPASFIRHDVTLKFLDSEHDSPYQKLWYATSDFGVRYTKMSMGWSMMCLPFFSYSSCIRATSWISG